MALRTPAQKQQFRFASTLRGLTMMAGMPGCEELTQEERKEIRRLMEKTQRAVRARWRRVQLEAGAKEKDLVHESKSYAELVIDNLQEGGECIGATTSFRTWARRVKAQQQSAS